MGRKEDARPGVPLKSGFQASGKRGRGREELDWAWRQAPATEAWEMDAMGVRAQGEGPANGISLEHKWRISGSPIREHGQMGRAGQACGRVARACHGATTEGGAFRERRERGKRGKRGERGGRGHFTASEVRF